MHKCTVIWQAALLCSLSQQHGVCRGRGDGSVLRVSVTSTVREPEQYNGHSTGQASSRVSDTGPQGTRRPGRELVQGTESRQRSLGSYFSKASYQAGRRGSNPKTEHGHCSVDEAGAESVLPHLYSTAVEFKKQQKDNPKFSLAHVPLRSVLALALFRELGVRLERVLKTPELMNNAETRGWRDQSGWKVPSVECPATSSRGGQGEANSARRADAASHSADGGVLQAASDRSVPLHPKDDGGYGLPGHLPHEHFSKVGGGGEIVESSLGSTGQLCPAADRGGLQKGGPLAVSVGPSPAGAHPSLRLQLTNTGNTCYMHAMVQVLAWLADIYNAPMEVALTSRVATVIKQFYKQADAPICLMQDIGWRMLIQGWRHDGQQQDVGEFFTFLTSRYDVHMLQGEWQARTLPERGLCRCMDRGPCSQPILLHFCDAPPGLRADLRVSDMLRFWHLGQNSLVLGLHVAPPILCFQLCRFRIRDGLVTKNQTAVDIDDTLYVPQFQGRSEAVAHLRYDFKACIVHHGPSLRCGHYTTLLKQAGVSWLCDDGRRARKRSSRTSYEGSTV